MQTIFDKEDAARMAKMLLVLVAIVSLYFAAKLVNEVRAYGTIGNALATPSTIDVNGSGDAVAVPNIATESFTAQDKEPTVAAAQDVVNKKIAAALAYLKSAGIADVDVKTTDYGAYPEYSYPCTGVVACPPSTMNQQPTITGYTVSQSVSVKIRDTSKVGAIVAGLGQAGVTGLSGPQYEVDDPSAVQDQARAKAIQDAQEKAEVLAKQLGVHIVRIARYSESTGGGAVTPMYATKDSMGASAGVQSAQLPAGENKYTSNVSVTYEIR